MCRATTGLCIPNGFSRHFCCCKIIDGAYDLWCVRAEYPTDYERSMATMHIWYIMGCITNSMCLQNTRMPQNMTDLWIPCVSSTRIFRNKFLRWYLIFLWNLLVAPYRSYWNNLKTPYVVCLCLLSFQIQTLTHIIPKQNVTIVATIFIQGKPTCNMALCAHCPLCDMGYPT